MTEFKAGDKVRVIGENLRYFGQEGVLLDTLAPYRVKLDSGRYVNLHRSELERVMDKVKVGDEVEVTCDRSVFFGEKGVVVGEGASVYKIRLVNGRCIHLFKWKLEKVEEEMEYEVGKPYLWFGGECPLPKGTKVKVRLGNKNFSDIRENWHWADGYYFYAEELDWEHVFGDIEIVMFEVVEYPKSTRKVEMELTEEEITTIKGVLGKVNL